MTAQPLSPTEHEIVFRLARDYRKPLVRAGVMLLVAAAVLAAAGAALGVPMFVLAGLCGLGVVGCAAAYLWRGRFRTVLTPRGIGVHGYFNHFIPWSQIAGFEVHSRGPARSTAASGANRAEQIQVSRASARGQLMTANDRPPKVLVVVRVVRVNGHRLTLRAPLVTGWLSDSEFDEKIRVLEQWRHQYGAPPTLIMPG